MAAQNNSLTEFPVSCCVLSHVAFDFVQTLSGTQDMLSVLDLSFNHITGTAIWLSFLLNCMQVMCLSLTFNAFLWRYLFWTSTTTGLPVRCVPSHIDNLLLVGVFPLDFLTIR